MSEKSQNAVELNRVAFLGWHVVRNKKRYIKLIKRGEDIRWSHYFGCWIWDFENRSTKGEK